MDTFIAAFLGFVQMITQVFQIRPAISPDLVSTRSASPAEYAIESQEIPATIPVSPTASVHETISPTISMTAALATQTISPLYRDFSEINAVVSLANDQPPSTPDGFVNGLSTEFLRVQSPELLVTLQKMLIEHVAFVCETPDWENWRVVGAHNSYLRSKYGFSTPYDDHTSSYLNLIRQNPDNHYSSQMNDAQRVKSHYCTDGTNRSGILGL